MEDATETEGTGPVSTKACGDCRRAISPVACSCPGCGAHYTAALRTFHRGLTYSGALIAALWLLLVLAKRNMEKWYNHDTMQALGDVKLGMFIVAAFLIGWGINYGRLRRDPIKFGDY